MITPVFTALLAAGFAAAQTVHNVQVGQGGTLTFSPSNFDAAQNDIIQFVFDAAGHSVTQSDLSDPCTSISGGFNSGFSTSAGEVWNLTVSSTSRESRNLTYLVVVYSVTDMSIVLNSDLVLLRPDHPSRPLQQWNGRRHQRRL